MKGCRNTFRSVGPGLFLHSGYCRESEPACSSCTILVQPWRTSELHGLKGGSKAACQLHREDVPRWEECLLERTWLAVLFSRLAGAIAPPRSTWATTNPQPAPLLVWPKVCSPQCTWWWVCLYTLLLCSADGREVRNNLPMAFHLLGQQLITIINY